MTRHRRSFTIRFEDQETHDLLSLLAGRLQVSMNSLAETMIKNEIGDMALALEEDLTHTLARLRDYRGDARDDVAAFAKAEVSHHDPLTARMVDERRSDPYGIADLYATASAETR